jgi:diacylglycerol kinase
MNYLKNRIKAFGFAFSGIYQALKTETNLRLHVIIAVFVILAGFYFSISKLEWFAVLLCVTLVICFEMFNSAIEKLCDLYSIEKNEKIKYIKDVCAGAVLVVSVFSAIYGCAIFWPYIQKLFTS